MRAARTSSSIAIFGRADDEAIGSRSSCLALQRFELFVRCAVRRIRDLAPLEPVPVLAELELDFQFSDPRPTYLPSRLIREGSGWRVTPVDWKGSFDLKSTASSNALLVLPAGQNNLKRGTLVEVVPFEGG